MAVERGPGTSTPDAVASPSRAADLDDLVDLAGLDSFPASDPPSWWAGPDVPDEGDAATPGR